MKYPRIWSSKVFWGALVLSLPLPVLIANSIARLPYITVRLEPPKKISTPSTESTVRDVTSETLALFQKYNLEELAPAIYFAFDAVHEPVALAAPTVRQQALALSQCFNLDRAIQEYIALARGGSSKAAASDTSTFWPLVAQSVMASFAFEAMGAGNWDEALKRVGEASDARNIDEQSGDWQVAESSFFAGQVLELGLRLNPPRDACTSAVALLEQLRKHPALIAVQIPEGNLPGAVDTEALSNLGQYLALEGIISDGASNANSKRPLIRATDVDLPWTYGHALGAELKHLVETNPQLFSNQLRRLPEFYEMEPVTVAIYASRHYNPYVVNAWRSRATITYLRMVQISYAARAYHFDHGKWPESVAQLEAAYVPPLSPAELERQDKKLDLVDAIEAGLGPLGPIKVAQRKVTPELVPAISGSAGEPGEIEEHPSEVIASLYVRFNQFYRVRLLPFYFGEGLTALHGNDATYSVMASGGQTPELTNMSRWPTRSVAPAHAAALPKSMPQREHEPWTQKESSIHERCRDFAAFSPRPQEPPYAIGPSEDALLQVKLRLPRDAFLVYLDQPSASTSSSYAENLRTYPQIIYVPQP